MSELARLSIYHKVFIGIFILKKRRIFFFVSMMALMKMIFITPLTDSPLDLIQRHRMQNLVAELQEMDNRAMAPRLRQCAGLDGYLLSTILLHSSPSFHNARDKVRRSRSRCSCAPPQSLQVTVGEPESPSLSYREIEPSQNTAHQISIISSLVIRRAAWSAAFNKSLAVFWVRFLAQQTGCQ